MINIICYVIVKFRVWSLPHPAVNVMWLGSVQWCHRGVVHLLCVTTSNLWTRPFITRQRMVNSNHIFGSVLIFHFIYMENIDNTNIYLQITYKIKQNKIRNVERGEVVQTMLGWISLIYLPKTSLYFLVNVISHERFMYFSTE